MQRTERSDLASEKYDRPDDLKACVAQQSLQPIDRRQLPLDLTCLLPQPCLLKASVVLGH